MFPVSGGVRLDNRGEWLQEVGFSADCGRDEFDRGLLHCSFPRRIFEQHPADPSGREFLSICRTGVRAAVSRGDHFVPVLADSAALVPAKAVPEDLTTRSANEPTKELDNQTALALLQSLECLLFARFDFREPVFLGRPLLCTS